MSFKYDTLTITDDNGTTVEGNEIPFTLEEDRADVFMHVEMSNCYTNYRTFAMSKDDDLVGSTLSPFSCYENERTANDMFFIRGKEFAMGPSSTYKQDDELGIEYGSGPLSQWINADGLYVTRDPSSPPEVVFPTYLRYRPTATTANPWRYAKVSKDELGKIQDAQHEYQMPTERVTPCGLNSISMYLDRAVVVRVDAEGTETIVDLDETNLAWDADRLFVKTKKALSRTPDGMGMNIKVKNDTDVPPGFMGPDDGDGGNFQDILSWLKPGPDETAVDLEDSIPVQRLLTWYRNPPSSSFKINLGRLPLLPQGDYKLRFTMRGTEWEQWGVITSITISQLSFFGSRNDAIPALCIVIGCLQLLFTAFLIVYKKKKD